MDKDFQESKKYTPHQFDNLDVRYQFKDFCQDDYADYVSCMRVNPKILENKIIHALPLSDFLTNCKMVRSQWEKCQEYREKEIFEDMKRQFDQQRQRV